MSANPYNWQSHSPSVQIPRDGVEPERLVLLFDEFDRYAEKAASAQPPGRGFFNDLEASRRSLPRLAILAAAATASEITPAMSSLRLRLGRTTW